MVYKFCVDQNDLYKSKLNKAKVDKKLLLVQFGFEQCPWCINLHKLFEGSLKSFTEKNYVVVEININEKSGKDLFERIKGKYKKGVKETGWPFWIIVNPQTNTSEFQDTADLEDNSKGQKGHDINKVKMALNKFIK